MNRKVALATSVLLVSKFAHAAPYLMGSVGAFESDSRCDPVYRSIVGGPDVTRCEKNPIAASLRIGYQWPSGPGLEAAYIQTSDAKGHLYDDPLRFRTDGIYGSGTYVEQLQRQKNRSIALAAIYSWDLTSNFSAVAKIGIAISRGRSTVELITNGSIPNAEQPGYTVEQTRSRHYLGADLRYQITATTFATVSCDFFTLGYDKFGEGVQGSSAVVAKAKMLTIGVGRKF